VSAARIQRDADRLRVDGGAAASDLLLRMQADQLGIPVDRPAVIETTALGAARLAGIAIGLWPTPAPDGGTPPALDRTFEPGLDAGRRDQALEDWHRAVQRARGWTRPPADR